MAKDLTIKGSEIKEHFRNNPHFIYYTLTVDGPAEVHNRKGYWEIAGNPFPVEELLQVTAFDPTTERMLT